MNQILILNDGTRLFDSHVIQDGTVLWVYLNKSLTLAEAFGVLNDPERTVRIVANEYGQENEYEGFTDLFYIRKEDNGQVSAGLKKAVIGNV